MSKRKRQFATLTRIGIELVDGRPKQVTRQSRVRVMTKAEGYAMVRYKGCIPFVASEKDLIMEAVK